MAIGKCGFFRRLQDMKKFEAFPKIPRFQREIIITEKLDGTNASVYIEEYTEPLSETVLPYGEPLFFIDKFAVWAGSRNRWISEEDDNFGFAAWVKENAEELVGLGPGHHYGEWWGRGIQRGYGLDKRVFSLFNVGRWNIENLPHCCNVVPTLYKGPLWLEPNNGSNLDGYQPFDGGLATEAAIEYLKQHGSMAAIGFMNPEGIIIYHTAGNVLFKQTLEKDNEPKSRNS